MGKLIMKTKARVIAFYLPQYHPTEINDKYWGKGFTEWTNVAKARPLYKGHYQPQIPADLGFYDLRLPEVRLAQAEMAREAGIEGFCYWYYWFGNGIKTLEMPINEVIRTHEPDFPFCIGWANHDWSNKTWQKNSAFAETVTFLKQEYPGKDDYIAFFNEIKPALTDERYIRIDNKPVFYIFDAESVPDFGVLKNTFNTLARENGLDGIYFIGRADPIGKIHAGKMKQQLAEAPERYKKLLDMGYDALNSASTRRAELAAGGMMSKIICGLREKLTGYSMHRYDYEKLMDCYYMPEDELEYVYPQVIPRKDKTPRQGRNALLYSGSTPERFRRVLRRALKCVEGRDYEHRIIFLNAWNEWGEGMYMEPDLEFGHGYLDALKAEICDE